MRYHDKLKELMDELAHLVYDITMKSSFPRDERFGLISQLRRATISVVLNYIEGYARSGTKQYKQFLNISYGSLKEVKYLLSFSHKRKYINKEDYIKPLVFVMKLAK